MTTKARPRHSVVTFDEIRVYEHNGAWCRLLWEDSGRVIILSDYGTWSHYWWNRGKASVPKFLAELDREYMGKKMMGAAVHEYSRESTVQCIRETILEQRRTGSMSRDVARLEWKLVRSLETGDRSFDLWCNESGIQDAWECVRREVCSTWANFWERLWVPHVRPLLVERGDA